MALPPLTAQEFYKYLKCPRWVYWDLFGDPAAKGEVPVLIERLREEGVAHERVVIEDLGPFEEIALSGTNEERFAATLAAMRRGAVIYQGVLMDNDWVGRPDVLFPRREPSRLGEWTYEPADVKSSRVVSEAQCHQLVFYALLLKAIQGAKPERGFIINVERQRLPVLIEEHESGFFKNLEAILAIRAGEKPDAVLTAGCKSSPWYDECRREAEREDSVGLLYKIYRSEYRRLREAGYGTLASLAHADPELLKNEIRGISDRRVEQLQRQARVLKDGKAFRIDEARLPEAPVEAFFDIEGDPTEGVDYLHGVLIRENGKDAYHAFAAERLEGEGEAWMHFCDFIERYEGAPIYHYGWYELEAIRRLSSKYGLSPAAARALDQRNMIDLHAVVQRCAVLPLYFYSLKDIARHLGFSWRAPDASGANSVAWFQEWLASGDRTVFTKILEYNEDDVLATAFLKDWLAKS